MGPVQTLQEFALNLLGDPQALEDFNADPQGVLDTAGLSDVSPADLQEILPLVMDSTPASVSDGDVPGGLLDLDLSGLPNLSGVFEAVSRVAEQTGLNTVTDDVLHTTSHLVDGVADAVQNVPLVGPVLSAGAIDLENTVDALDEHLYDGKLIGAVVDATTNHLGDALMPGALVDGVTSLPIVGQPVGGLLNDVRYEGGAILGTVNEAIGSTPVGVHSGQALAAAGLTDLHSTLDAITAPVTGATAGLPIVDDLLSTLTGGQPNHLDSTSEVTGGQTGHFDSTSDVSDTLDHAADTAPAASPAIPALPAAVPALPAVIPALPAAVGGVVGSVTHTLTGVVGHLPVIGGVLGSATGSTGTGLPDGSQDAVDHASDVHSASASATGLVGHAPGLAIGDLTEGVDQHAGGLFGGDLHLGH